MQQNLLEQPRRFKGVWIPREVWLDPKMTIVEKALLAEIDSLDNEDGCTAGNFYFARFFQISDRQIKRYISRLAEEGWIKVGMIGRNRRRITVMERLHNLRDTSDTPEGHKRPSAEGHKRPYNNTRENNPINNLAAGAAGVNKKTDLQRVTDHYFQLLGIPVENNPQYARHLRSGKELLRQAGGITEAIAALNSAKLWFGERELSWTMDTVVKHWDKIGTTGGGEQRIVDIGKKEVRFVRDGKIIRTEPLRK